jgi:hypothetical protein
MSKRNKRAGGIPRAKASPKVWLLILGVTLVAAAGLWWTSQPPVTSKSSRSSAQNSVGSATRSRLATNFMTTALNFSTNDTNVTTMEVAHSVMVTHELDFGERVLSPAEALLYIERQSKADDGLGRTFSVLEASGFTNENKKLQLSLRVSTEKPGLAAIVFTHTGRVLWQARIVPREGPPPSEKQLTVMMDEEDGKQVVVDGSKNPTSILDAAIHQSALTMREHWPNGTERNFTFIYSACGCPVKAKVRRVGEKTMRTSDWPVLFPDDPDAMRVINALMGWPSDGIPR